jgi:hypothetical protein
MSYEENNPPSIPPKKNAFDLLNHEIAKTMAGDRTLKKIEAILFNPANLKNMSYEQLVHLMEKVTYRQNCSRNYILEFYKVSSKSQAIFSALEKFTTTGEQGVIGETKALPDEKSAKAKQLILKALERLEAEEDNEIIIEGNTDG